MPNDLRAAGPKRQCTATTKHGDRAGERCGASAIKGGSVCAKHGGRAPQVRAKAQERLEALVEPALVELGKIVRAKGTSDADKIKACAEILDRYAPTSKRSAQDVKVDGNVTVNDQSAQARSLAEMIEQERARIQARQTTVKRLDRE
jgi:hypothetical protein